MEKRSLYIFHAQNLNILNSNWLFFLKVINWVAKHFFGMQRFKKGKIVLWGHFYYFWEALINRKMMGIAKCYWTLKSIKTCWRVNIGPSEASVRDATAVQYSIRNSYLQIRVALSSSKYNNLGYIGYEPF